MRGSASIAEISKIIKSGIKSMAFNDPDITLKIDIISKLCDIALKIKKLEELEGNLQYQSTKLDDAEIQIIEDYIKRIKKI